MSERKQAVTKAVSIVKMEDTVQRVCNDVKGKYGSKRLVCWLKVLADDILKYFSYYPHEISFNVSCKLPPGDKLHEKSNKSLKDCLWKQKHITDRKWETRFYRDAP